MNEDSFLLLNPAGFNIKSGFKLDSCFPNFGLQTRVLDNPKLDLPDLFMLSKKWVFLLSLILLSTVPAGCGSLFSPDQTLPPADLPEQFTIQSATSADSHRWWEGFSDPELDSLVDKALSDNFSLKQAWARLRQAQAIAVQAGASLSPSLSAGADARVGRQRFESGTLTTRGINDYGLGLLSNYEIDLWGRVRSDSEAARLTAIASREDLNTAAITLTAAVTEHWIEIISFRMQNSLLHKQLQNNQILLELVELRFQNALASALDVYQQRQVVARIESEIPVIEESERRLANELSILVGSSAGLVKIARENLPEPAPLPSTGLPADLLMNRPDIKAAGLRLQSAKWQVASARADRLPALKITGRARLGDGEPDVLLETWLLDLAVNLTAPILDGGRRAAEVDRTRAVADENFAAYRDTVLTAVKEVENALIGEVKQREHLQGLEREIELSRLALEEASHRYRKGLNDYLPVLTQLLSVQGLERELVRSRADLLKTRIRLYRSLGGRWPETLSPPQTPADTVSSGE